MTSQRVLLLTTLLSLASAKTDCDDGMAQWCPNYQSQSKAQCLACVAANWVQHLSQDCKSRDHTNKKCGASPGPSPGPGPTPPGPSPHPTPPPFTPARPLKPTIATPSIVFMLTDDQDIQLGSMNAMSFTRALGQSGANFTNFFAHTPVCCPSRSEIMTGRYFHSIRDDAFTPDGCMHINTTTGDTPTGDQLTFAGALQRAGYATGVFGKYLNNGGMESICGGIGKVGDAGKPITPLGWSEYMGACPDTCYVNCHYQHDGADDFYGDATFPNGSNYGTSVIGNASVAFVRRAMAANWPFFVEIASHAPHGPATPAPWYADLYSGKDVIAPRTKSWNVTSKDKHWVVATQPKLTHDYVEERIDSFYKNRLRSLRSVDDIIATLHAEIDAAGRLDTTYFVFTGDHGLHMGQFCLGPCKRQPYETDIRIPMIFVGPGIAAGQMLTAMAGTVDLAPTFLALAGVKKGDEPLAAIMDGRSLLPLVMSKRSTASSDTTTNSSSSSNTNSNNNNNTAWAAAAGAPVAWRDAYLIEYIATKNVNGDPKKAHLKDNPNNTFIGLRIYNSSMNVAYFEFTNAMTDWEWEHSNFCEFYDIASDPAQLVNGCNALDAATRTKLHEQLRTQYACGGETCA